MTRKARKSQNFWTECDSCKSIINAKDLELHSNACPPNENSWVYSFIKEKTFYSTYEDVDVKVVPTWMRAQTVEDVVFISQSVMQICEFIIGFPIVINVGGKKCIKKAWPTPEVCLTSVILSKEALKSCDSNLTSNLIIISKLENFPSIVRELHYRISNIEEEYIDTEELSLILRNKFKEKVFFNGNKFLVQFYGKKLSIQVSECKHYVLDITEIKKMTLDDHPYTCDDNTQFVCQNKFKKDNTISPPLQEIKFGGYDSIILELKQNMSLALQKTASDDIQCVGILIHGMHGIGKTLAINYLANLFQVNVVNIQGMDVFSKYYGEAEGKLRASFTSAISKTPSIILLDNIEALCPRKGSDQEKRVVSTVLSLFDSIQHKKIVVLATTSKLDNIEPSLRRPGRLEIEVEIPVPSASDRLAIMRKLLPQTNITDSIIKVAEITHGFVGADLAALIGKAQSKAIIAGRSEISDEDIMWAHSQVMPSAMREVFVQVPNVKWSDVAGQEELKLKLQQCVEWPVKYPDSFTRLGVKPPRGVLLYGPPGCSKTMIAKAIATESQLNFLSIKGSDIFSKWVGESERAIRDVFKRARCVAPCIIFIDEVDALGGERESSQRSGGSAVQERVLSQLLTEMDGVMPLENVIVIAATNRPDRMDKALLRPGRLDRIIYVPLPDRHTREQLFELQFRKMPIESGIDVQRMAEATNGYSGAEIVAVCNEAALKALEESIQADVVRVTHFTEALQIVKPRTPKSLLDLYENYINT